MKRHRQCEICGNGINLLPIKEIRFSLPDSYKIPSGYEIVSCRNCGFCYADTLASIDDYNYYYTHYNYYSGAVHVRTPNDMSKNVIVDLLNEISVKQARILDIGFGDGEQLLLLKEAGYENLFGIDPSSESVAHIKGFGISADIGNIYDLDVLEDGEMDVVIATGVLEHLVKPSFAVDNIRKFLKRGGLLIVTAPNCLNLVNDLSPLSNNFNQEHINYFSPVSLKNLMGKVGFFEEKIIAEEKYTDMFGVFSYKGEEYATNKFAKDAGVIKAIKTYLERQEENENKYNKKIEKFVHGETLVAVWGTGAFTMNLLSNSDLKYCRIACFVDNNMLKCGSDFCGARIVSPKDLVNNTHIEAVIIASIKSAEEIRKQLLELGWNKEIIIM